MADAVEIPEVELSEARLLAAACNTSELSDWGDQSFRTPLKIYLEAIEKTANLHHLGRFLLYPTALRLLTNRLKMERDVQSDPAILETPIPRPLVILGLSRTATTLLHTLLACDPNSRALRLWEGMFPTPPPRPDTWAADPRIITTKNLVAMFNQYAARLPTTHALEPTGPEECLWLFEPTFADIKHEIRAHVPD